MEITDAMIVRAALHEYAKRIWQEVEDGSRYFGTDLYVDLFERALEIRAAIEKGALVINIE